MEGVEEFFLSADPADQFGLQQAELLGMTVQERAGCRGAKAARPQLCD